MHVWVSNVLPSHMYHGRPYRLLLEALYRVGIFKKGVGYMKCTIYEKKHYYTLYYDEHNTYIKKEYFNIIEALLSMLYFQRLCQFNKYTSKKWINALQKIHL